MNKKNSDGKKFLDVKIPNKTPTKTLEDTEFNQLSLKLVYADEINNSFAEKQLKKQELKQQISMARKELNYLEKQLDEMAIKIEKRESRNSH